MANHSLKSLFFISTATIAMFAASQSAQAACTPTTSQGSPISNVTVTCSGTVNGQNGTNAYGTGQENGLNLTVDNTGALLGQTGINVGDSNTINNQGSITGNVNAGIIAANNNTIINSGSIVGSISGVEIGNPIGPTSEIITNLAGGTIHGGSFGIDGSLGTLQVTNAGTIKATGAGGKGISASGAINLDNQAGGIIQSGIFASQTAFSQLQNDGSIDGGVTYFGSFINNSSLTSSSSAAVLASGSGFTNNTGGTVTATDTAVIGTSSLVNNAGGSIQGATAIDLSGGGSKILNSGTLTGTGGTAIKFDDALSGANELHIQPGSVINGLVLGAGSDSLFFDGGGTATFSLNNFGAQYVGFSNVFVDPGFGSTRVFTSSTNNTSIWSILSGTMVLGDGVTNGTLNTTIHDFSLLKFNLGQNQGFSGTIDGSGGLEVVGSHNLILTGTAGMTGGTVIDANAELTVGQNSATGTLTGNVADAGELAFSRSDTYTFSGGISGAGLIEKLSTGRLILNGPITSTGAIDVGNGILEMDGNDTTSGLVTVESGATLTGTGHTGAAGALILSGGTLAGTQGQTLHMNDLTLQPGAITDVTLGAPGNSTGLFDVAGDLQLDGTLNVHGGTGFGQGLYRLFDYAGSLTGAMGISATPGGTSPGDFLIQTGTAHQVNLLYQTGIGTDEFWDGDGVGNANNGMVDGGDGTWTATSANFTDPNGNNNAAMNPQPGFAIFSGSPGNVTTDNTNGNISVTGMQFAVNGYHLNGDAITLADPLTEMRVGDGSQAGSGYFAFVGNQLTGTGGLEKTDLGALFLTGQNDYTGVTQIDDGALVLENNGSISNSSGVIDNATFDISLVGSGVSTITTLSGGGAVALGNNLLVLSAAGDTFGGRFTSKGPNASVGVSAGTEILTGNSTGVGLQIAPGATVTFGNGGTSGGIDGPIVDNGTLTVNRADTVTIDQPIAGTGILVQDGAGTLILATPMANPVTLGQVIAAAGVLDVETQVNAPVLVGSGGTLTGDGNIVGAVNVQSFATLANREGRTLTMDSLLLNGSAHTAVSLGTPGNTAGLFAVTHDLTLDGVLDINATTGFGPGIYRIFDYGGTLTDNGMQIGLVPSGDQQSDFQIQTSIAGQVNLISNVTQQTNFWDGQGPGADGTIQGGSGTWTPTSANFTDASGSTNGALPAGAFAIFAAAPGTVTVDDSAGAPSVSGMQFAVDGYQIVGGSIDLSDPDTIIRVGDGTQAGQGYTATISSVLTGTGGLEKTDHGTLVLLGDMQYTGGTKITNGILQLGNATQAGVVQGDIDDESVLVLAGHNSHANGVITGAGRVIVASGADASFVGDETYTGGTTIQAQGQLNIGAGGTTGSLVGDVQDDGTLDFARSDNVTYGGVISGSGIVLDEDPGVLTLTGASTFTGDVRVLGGTLALTGAGSLADANTIDLFAGSNLDVSGANGDTTLRSLSGAAGDQVAIGSHNLILTNAFGQFDGTITGSGGLHLTGGVETLRGDNTYTGGTTIDAGATLGLGDNGGNGTIKGDVTDNGIFAIGGVGSQTFAGVISGAGEVDQNNTGTTLLSASNTYSGGTRIAAGTLIGSANSFGSGAITDITNLVIDQPVDAVFANAINGNGSFTKRGAGSLNLTGTSTLTGATSVEAGRLAVNGSLAKSVVTVKSGATLGGNGTVGGVVAQNGGTVAPGNSIGTLNVNGNYSAAAGSNYAVELDSAGHSDKMVISGTANIASGALLTINKTDAAAYVPGTVYTVLTADGGVTGAYTLVGGPASGPFYGLGAQYDAKHVYLSFGKIATFASAGVTPNQIATGGGADSLPVNNALASALLVLPSVAAAQGAFDQLSGEIHASARTVLLEDSRFVREAALDRLQSPNTGRPVVWGQGFGDWGSNDGNGNAAGVTHSTQGFIGGVDVPVYQTWRVGFMGGFSDTKINVKDRASTGTSTNYHLGLYGGTETGPVAVRLGAAYSWNDLQTARTVAFSGFSDQLTALYNGGTTQAFGEVGYKVDVGSVNLEPFANVAYVNLNIGGFGEQGGASALTVGHDAGDTTFTTLGLHAKQQFSLGTDTLFTAHAGLGWRHAMGAILPVASNAFGGGTAFSIDGVPLAQDAAAFDAGFDAAVGSQFTLSLGYTGQYAATAQDNGVKASVAWKF